MEIRAILRPRFVYNKIRDTRPLGNRICIAAWGFLRARKKHYPFSIWYARERGMGNGLSYRRMEARYGWTLAKDTELGDDRDPDLRRRHGAGCEAAIPEPQSTANLIDLALLQRYPAADL